MTIREGELVLDPFGGSGTTRAVCERKNRRWVDIEITSTDAIIERLSGELRGHKNRDRVDD
jgi:site-specific DNA-methyltransferase (adenine-specific)